MLSPQFILALNREKKVDWFAGGGGMAEAIERATGSHVDDSCNHDDDALSMHMVNHPQSRHWCADVREVCPHKVADGWPVGLFHMSPDCTDHSQAKGGQPRDQETRSLSWVGVRWAGQERPRIITLENVKQILKWGPLIAKRCPVTGRVIKLDRSIAELGERVPVQEQFLIPDPKRAGQSWRRFVAILRGMGYEVEWRILCAADYGVPTTRSRLFMVARCDGAPIVWPEPTHFKNPKSGQKRWRAAAECIDWSIKSRSIFERKRPLAEATMRRIATGMRRYVLDSADPFLVPVKTWGGGGNEPRDIRQPVPTTTTSKRGDFALVSSTLIPVTHSRDTAYDVRQPIRTTTTAKGGETALATATLVQTGYGERKGQQPRALDLLQPLGTTVAGGCKHGLVTAFMAQANAGFNEREAPSPGRDVRQPLTGVTTTGSQQQLISAQLTSAIDYELSAEHEAGALRCAAFLIRYHGHGGQWADLRDPMTTSTTRDRLALVTVWIRGEPWVIVDICLRMLEPRELYTANGFSLTYRIDRGHDGRVFSKSTQIRLCGNAVPPGLGEAVIRAQWDSRPPMREAA